MIRQTSATIQFKADSYFHLTWDDASRLTQIGWLRSAPLQLNGRDSAESVPVRINALLGELKTYFADGSPLKSLSLDQNDSDLLDLDCLTEFQKLVFRAVIAIPHGETRTYLWVAMRIGKPKAARAVGQALRRNPFPVVVPCHRVVSGKNLGGFMGTKDPTQSEVVLKTHLIETEKKYIHPTFSFAVNASHGNN